MCIYTGYKVSELGYIAESMESYPDFPPISFTKFFQSLPYEVLDKSQFGYLTCF